MSTGEHEHESSPSTTLDESAQAQAADQASPEGAEGELEAAAETKPKLELEVEITDAGPCKKHVKVAVSRADIERQFNDSIGEFKREAAIPGFRPGHAPKQLVQKRFRKEVGGQVKAALLMASMEQLDKDYKLNPIAQPDIDVEAIELPEAGPMRFEIDVEVEPEFGLPDYKSLTVQRPVKTVTDADVEAQMRRFLERYSQIVPKLEGGAELEDYITADLRFDRDGVLVNEAKEVQFRLQPELRFQDGHVPGLADALLGAKPGDVREANAEIGMSSPDPAIRGRTIRVTFNVLDLKRLRLPEVNQQFLQSVGFDSEEELRTALRGVLDRRLQFQQRQAVRRAILQKLTEQTSFDLPADLVARQEQATLRRQVLEMRNGGMTDAEIRAREAEVRANIHASTLNSLKEFFILSKIAEAEEIKIDEADVEQEIEVLAAQTDESPRRVRSRIEKDGLGEALASQILERKTIDHILQYVKYEEVQMVDEKAVETLDQTAAAPQPEGEAPGAEGTAEGTSEGKAEGESKSEA